MSRRGRSRYCRRVVIGGRPVAAVSAALLEMRTRPGEVWSAGIAHDEGCPALRHGLRACDCREVLIRAERVK